MPLRRVLLAGAVALAAVGPSCRLPATFRASDGGGSGSTDTGGPPTDSGDGGGGGGTDSAAVDSGANCGEWGLQFDGVDDYVEVPADAGFDGLIDLTVEAWVRIDAADPTSFEGHIVAHSQHWSFEGWVLMTNGGVAEFRVYDGLGGWGNAIGSTPLASGVWYHLAGTYSPTGAATGATRVWVDGVEDGMNTNDTAMTVAFNGPVVIGKSSYDTAFGFEGAIDEVRVSKSVRYTATFTPPTMPLPSSGSEALWHLNEGMGGIVIDMTSNDHDGRLGSVGGTDENDPAWVSLPCIADR